MEGENLDKGQLEVHLEGEGGREGEDFISRDRKRSGGSSGIPGTAWYGAQDFTMDRSERGERGVDVTRDGDR